MRQPRSAPCVTSFHSWRNPGNGRRYQAVLGPDLFGDWTLWRGWCSADGRRGGERQDVFTWQEEAEAFLRWVGRRRERRGYLQD
jgi:hypothetical protein